MPPYKDLTGLKFGRLTAIEVSGKDRSGRYIWKCVCDCGNVKNVIGNSLSSGNTKSCVCLGNQLRTERFTLHGMAETRIYKIWVGMKDRCFNPKNTNYGKRGITVCERWLKFENFRDDTYESYQKHVEEFGENQTSIDRINNDGNYEPSNCRWATLSEQSNNTRRQVKFSALSPNGLRYIADNQRSFAKFHKLSEHSICNCLKGRLKTHKGWVFEYV